MIGNRAPTEIDTDLRNVLFHPRRPFARYWCGNHRRGHHYGLALNKRTRCFDIHVNTEVAFQAKALHRLATLCAHFIIVGTFVDHGCVVISDVGDVGRLVNDRYVALRRHNGGLGSLRAEFSCRNKTILVGTDVVIIIGPIVDAGALIESRFRRQRRPTNVIVALSPGDPGRRPFITRHPNPADSAQARPASVVISRPTEWLLGNPGPAGVGVNPATVSVRTPSARAFCFARLPNVAVIACLQPRAMRFEFGIKSRIARSRSRSRNRTRTSNRFGFGLFARSRRCGGLVLLFR